MPNKKKRSKPSANSSYSIASLLQTPAVPDPPVDESALITDLIDDDSERELAKFFELLAAGSVTTFDDAAIECGVAEINSSLLEVDFAASLSGWKEEVAPPQSFSSADEYSDDAGDLSEFIALPTVAPLKDNLATVIANSSVAEDVPKPIELERLDLPSAPMPSNAVSIASPPKVKLVLRRADLKRTEPEATSSASSAATLPTSPILRLRVPASTATLPTSPILRLRITASAKTDSHADALSGAKRKRDEAAEIDLAQARVDSWLARLRTYGFTDVEIEKLQQHPLGSNNILTIVKTYSWLTKYGFNHEQINALGAQGGPKAIMLIILKREELKQFFTIAQIVKIMSQPESINQIDKVISFAKASIKESATASSSLAFAAPSSCSVDNDLGFDN